MIWGLVAEICQLQIWKIGRLIRGKPGVSGDASRLPSSDGPALCPGSARSRASSAPEAPLRPGARPEGDASTHGRTRAPSVPEATCKTRPPAVRQEPDPGRGAAPQEGPTLPDPTSADGRARLVLRLDCCEQLGSDPKIRRKEEAKLAELKASLEQRQKSERERKLAVRYHKVVFLLRPQVECAHMLHEPRHLL